MGRAPCCDKANVKRGPWSPDEDAILKAYIDNHGTGGNWITLPQRAGLRRCGKSCRLRWLNYLRPDIKHGCFTEEEDNIICSLFLSIGSRWSVIASNLQGRTDNDVKNYWNTKLKKKLIAAGTIPDPTEVVNIHGTSTRDNNNDKITHSVTLCTNLSAPLHQLQLRPSTQSFQEASFVSPSPYSLPDLAEMLDHTINYIADGNMDFQVSSSQEYLRSSSSSSSVSTKQSYCNLSIDDLLDLDFGTVYEILSTGIGFDQVTSNHHHSHYLI